MKKFLQLLKIVGIGFILFMLLQLFTKGRALNALLFLSLLSISLSLAFFIPVIIAEVVARVYESIDKDEDRRMWLGYVIRGLGIFEGSRNLYHDLHCHSENRDEMRSHRYHHRY